MIPLDAQQILAEAERLGATGQYRAALALLDTLTSSSDDPVRAGLLRGRILVQQGQFDAAIDHWRAVQAIHPENIEIKQALELAMRMKDDEWDQVIAVNLTAAFRLSRAVLRGMMKKRGGRMIQITSVVGTTGNPGQGNYAAAKAGLVGMSKSLAAEVASRNITVNAVAPGFIQTAMTDVLTDDQKKMIADRIPAGRMGQPGEIAAAVVYLASDEAAYVTGETIQINGGMAMI